MSLYIIGENEAKEIAERFLQQHHSVSGIEKPVLDDGVWIVNVFVSEPKSKKFRITIDAKSGQVQRWQ